MYTMLFIATMLIFLYYGLTDIHSAVAAQLKYSPEVKVSWFAKLVYRVIQSIKERKYIARV